MGSKIEDDNKMSKADDRKCEDVGENSDLGEKKNPGQ